MIRHFVQMVQVEFESNAATALVVSFSVYCTLLSSKPLTMENSIIGSELNTITGKI